MRIVDPMITAPYPYDSGLGPLPIILLSAFGVAATANGMSLMMEMPSLFSLFTAVVLQGFKLYFLLRYEPRGEQTVGGRRDKNFGYAILAIILFTLTAYGLFGLSRVTGGGTIIQDQTIHDSITFLSFIKATLAKGTAAIVCWIVAAVIEVISLIIVMRDHREYEYWE
jgi:hypothetical protein